MHCDLGGLEPGRRDDTGGSKRLLHTGDDVCVPEGGYTFTQVTCFEYENIKGTTRAQVVLCVSRVLMLLLYIHALHILTITHFKKWYHLRTLGRG